MVNKPLQATFLLLLASFIWGTTFVAQRISMGHIGPFMFTALRFALGGLLLMPVFLFLRARQPIASVVAIDKRMALLGGGCLGILLFSAATIQQVSLIYTAAGKAGFITGLYVILVPLLGLVWRQYPDLGTWVGSMLAVMGLYLLSVGTDFSLAYGDFLVLISTIFWALHVLAIAWFVQKVDALLLAITQFLVCALLSFLVAVVVETITLQSMMNAGIPILYGGLLSVGIAYTLQIIGQRHLHPTSAALIMSTETIFAALAGWLILGETFSERGIIGCILMLTGIILSQLQITYSRLQRCYGWLIAKV
ncbi:DMT family transporter [Beggiatoa leptomitoformis]|uniref:EamA family transporter n=1 Tax=Beggiatoa leptomitoformis TaxID=288004 RepID=A0A2N9YJL0_9GAMM|nr:DMT family transporter [Beggiatoa leptomitoformis]ALG67608.1 EamA family transporter [Beggiatoa leptomitoformis]AUI70678.2 EamA family transporter [Beggiatoa leptomitoformis]